MQIAQQNQVNLQSCQTHCPIQMNIIQLATASKGQFEMECHLKQSRIYSLQPVEHTALELHVRDSVH